MKLRILSYNIHKGFSFGNRGFVLQEIKQSIDQVHADVVFLQEVVGESHPNRGGVSNWPTNTQFEFLADKVWHHYAYGKNAVYSTGHHGNAVLSKFPIIDWRNTDVSTNRFEKRGFLHARVELPELGKTISLICVHLNLLENDRLRQIHRLADYVEQQIETSEPLILAGDFNDWSGRVGKTIEKRLGLKEAYHEIYGVYPKTFPAFAPFLRLDRIMFRGFRGLKAHILTGEPWKDLSDHAALDAELELL